MLGREIFAESLIASEPAVFARFKSIHRAHQRGFSNALRAAYCDDPRVSNDFGQ